MGRRRLRVVWGKTKRKKTKEDEPANVWLGLQSLIPNCPKTTLHAFLSVLHFSPCQNGHQTMMSVRNAIFVGGHKVSITLVFPSQLLIRNRSPGEQRALERSASFQGNILNCLLIFLQSKQMGKFKEYA